MTSPLRVSLIQLAYADEESVADRTARVADLVRTACSGPGGTGASGGGDAGAPHLVMLPELWPQTGFGYQLWDDLAEPVEGPTAEAMSALARECGVLLHAG